MTGGAETAARLEAAAKLKPNPEDLFINNIPGYMPGISLKEYLPTGQKALEGHQREVYSDAVRRMAPVLTRQDKERQDTIKALLGYEAPGIRGGQYGKSLTNILGHAAIPQAVPPLVDTSSSIFGIPSRAGHNSLIRIPGVNK